MSHIQNGHFIGTLLINFFVLLRLLPSKTAVRFFCKENLVSFWPKLEKFVFRRVTLLVHLCVWSRKFFFEKPQGGPLPIVCPYCFFTIFLTFSYISLRILLTRGLNRWVLGLKWKFIKKNAQNDLKRACTLKYTCRVPG